MSSTIAPVSTSVQNKINLNRTLTLINGEATVVEYINADFAIINYANLQMTYSVLENKINAHKLIKYFECIANKHIELHDWFKIKEIKRIVEAHPEYVYHQYNKVGLKYKNKLAIKGIYIDPAILINLISWSHPVLGNNILNGITEPITIDESGFIYLVKPEKYLNTDVCKVGKAIDTQRRFRDYGKKMITYHIVAVDHMPRVEKKLKLECKKVFKIAEGTEYFHVPNFKDIEDIYFNVLNDYISTEDVSETGDAYEEENEDEDE
jgi:hypothetical protein